MYLKHRRRGGDVHVPSPPVFFNHKSKSFLRSPIADFSFGLVGQNLVMWSTLLARDAGKTKNRIFRIGLEQAWSKCWAVAILSKKQCVKIFFKCMICVLILRGCHKKSHKLGGFNNRHSGGWKLEIKVSACLVSSEVSLLCRQSPSHCVLTCSSLCAHISLVSFCVSKFPLLIKTPVRSD